MADDLPRPCRSDRSPAHVKHLHLDPLGGIAGDMFAAALMQAFPAHAADAIGAAEAASGVACRLLSHQDQVFAGQRFAVAAPDHHHGHRDRHGHTTWRSVRDQLERSRLPAPVRAHALGIFARLAAAEARVHGVELDAVTFHEVGAADSIADIVAAAWLIDAVGAARWTVASLPLGGGRIRTAHGPMPVPAPATALLLEGFDFHDDGIPGERVTPTGAAILRHLVGDAPPQGGSGPRGRIVATGIGFGTREMSGLSNVLRVLAFESGAGEHPAPAGHRDLAVIGFEVDDQSGEDLAAGLDRLRALPGVHDVLQMPAYGKKSRLAVHVQVLAAPDRLDAIVDACFHETTTIGLRTHLVQGRALHRRLRAVEIDGRTVRVKSVDRHGGPTAKAEADDALHLAGQGARARLRRQAEQAAMDTDNA